MAIHAVYLDGVACLAVEFAVAVAVLLEVAVHAMHPLFKVDVLEVYRLLELLRIVEGNNLVVRVEQVALAVVLEDSAEDPSVTMEVGKLRVLKLLIEFRCTGLFQKGSVRPQTPNGGSLGIARLGAVLLVSVRTALLSWPHVFAIHFVVPPGVAEVRRNHIRTRMNVADHALARRNRTRELMTDSMTRLVTRNRGVGSRGLSKIAMRCISAGMFGRPVVRIDDVTGTASAGTIIAGLIVGTRKREERVQQASFLQSQHNRISTQFCAETACTQLDLGLTGIFRQAG